MTADKVVCHVQVSKASCIKTRTSIRRIPNMKRMYLQLFISGLLIFINCKVVNGSASVSCLDCLTKIQPEDGCVVDPIRGLFCGPYRISQAFFEDCKNFVPDPDFKNCSSDLSCATECVKAWQERFEGRCLVGRRVAIGEDYGALRCADYARMHVFGSRSCGQDDTPAILQKLSTLEKSCGCDTLYGQGKSCPTTTVVPANNAPAAKNKSLLLLYILLPCGIAIICAVAVCICFIYRTRRTGRHEEDETAHRLKAKQNDRGTRAAIDTPAAMYTVGAQPRNPSLPSNPAPLPPQYKSYNIDPGVWSPNNLPTSPTSSAAYLVNSTAPPLFDPPYEKPISTQTPVPSDKPKVKAPKPVPRKEAREIKPPITYVEDAELADNQYANKL